MGNDVDQTMDKKLDLTLPATIYSRRDIQEDLWSSLAFAPGELGDLSLFPEMPPLQTNDWSLETFGYVYDGPHVYEDGHMDNATHPPEYYLYSPPRNDTWEDGLQTIEDFDWSAIETADDVTTPEVAETVFVKPGPLPAAITIDSRSVEGPQAQQLDFPPRQPLPDEDTKDTAVAAPHLSNIADIPLIAGHAARKEVFQNILPEPESDRTETSEQDSSQDIDIVDAEAVEQPAPAGPLPIPNPATKGPSDSCGPAVLHMSNASLAPLFDVESSGDLLTSRATPEAVPYEVPTARLQASQSPTPAFEPPLPESPPSSQKNVTEGPSQAVSDRQMWEAQLQEAAAESHTADFPELPPPGNPEVAEEAGGDQQEEIMEVDKMDTEVQSDPQPFAPSENKDSRQASTTGAHSHGILLHATDFDEERFVDVSPPLVDTTDTRKRAKSTLAKESSDTEAGAPEKKKIKMLSETSDSRIELDDTSSTASDCRSTVASSKKPRCDARKSVKESARQVVGEGAATKQRQAKKAPLRAKLRLLAPKPEPEPEPKTKPRPKPAEIVFEEDTRPTAALNREEEDVESSHDDFDADEDMQERLSDAPIPSFTRSPRDTVSNRELQGLGSNLVPGMHLGLQHKQERIRRPAESSFKSPNADNSFLLVEAETAECEATPIESKKRRAASTKKAPAPKRARPATKAQPRTSRAKKDDTIEPDANDIEPEASDEGSSELFPAARLEKKTADKAKAPTPLNIMPTKFTKGKKNATNTTSSKAAPRKSRARIDSKLEEDDIASALASDVDELPFTLDKPSTPQANKYMPKSNVSHLMKQVTASGTPTPSVASNGSSPMSNKYGFKPSPSPRKTRSAGAKTLAAKGKAKATMRKQMKDATEGSKKGKARAKSVEQAGDRDEDDGKMIVKESEKGRRSTRHTSATAPGSGNVKEVRADNDDDEEGDGVEVAVQESELRRSTRHVSTAAPEPIAPATKDLDSLRRSTRHTSAAAAEPDPALHSPAPQAKPETAKKNKGVKVEAQDTEKRTTRRALAFELEKKDRNIGKRLRSGDGRGG